MVRAHILLGVLLLASTAFAWYGWDREEHEEADFDDFMRAEGDQPDQPSEGEPSPGSGTEPKGKPPQEAGILQESDKPPHAGGNGGGAQGGVEGGAQQEVGAPAASDHGIKVCKSLEPCQTNEHCGGKSDDPKGPTCFGFQADKCDCFKCPQYTPCKTDAECGHFDGACAPIVASIAGSAKHCKCQEASLTYLKKAAEGTDKKAPLTPLQAWTEFCQKTKGSSPGGCNGLPVQNGTCVCPLKPLA